MSILMMDDSEILGTEEVDVSAVEGELMIDESAQIDAELQELEIAIQVTGEQAEEAEQLHDEVAATVEDGGEGLTQQSAVFVHRSLATLAALNGQKGHTYFTVQSFAVAGDSRQVTLQALDTIKSFIKRYWEKLKAFLRKWYLKVGEFYDKHGSKAGRMAKAFDGLIKKLNNKSGKPKEQKIKIAPTHYQRLVIDSKDDIKNVSKNVDALVTEINKVPSIGKTALSDYKNFLGGLDKTGISQSDLEKYYGKLGVSLTDGLNVKIPDLKAGSHITRAGKYIGGYSVTASATTKMVGNDTRHEVVTGISMDIRVVDGDLRITDDDEVPALTRQGTNDLALTGAKLCRMIYKASGELRTQSKALDEALEKGTKTVERLAKEAEELKGGGTVTINNVTLALPGNISAIDSISSLTAVLRGNVAYTRLFLKQAAVTAGSIYSYANASYNNLTTEA